MTGLIAGQDNVTILAVVGADGRTNPCVMRCLDVTYLLDEYFCISFLI